MEEPYKRPALTGVFNVLGALSLIGGGFMFLIAVSSSERGQGEAIALSLATFLTGIVQLGIAEVINFIGQTAYNTGKLVRLMDARETPGAAPVPTAKAFQPTPRPATGNQYYYMDGAQPEGPVGAEVLRNMLLSRRLTNSTLVCKEGTEEWKELGQVITL